MERVINLHTMLVPLTFGLFLRLAIWALVFTITNRDAHAVDVDGG
jgi:uncharacterized membrane protein